MWPIDSLADMYQNQLPINQLLHYSLFCMFQRKTIRFRKNKDIGGTFPPGIITFLKITMRGTKFRKESKQLIAISKQMSKLNTNSFFSI